MILLGIDPGATTGWCRYSGDAKRVLASGYFREHNMPDLLVGVGEDEVVIEGFGKVHGSIYPQVVQAAYICGRLVERVVTQVGLCAQLTRHEVKGTLHRMIHGAFPVLNDRDVWAALKLLHGGEDAAKKGGPLHGVKEHGRAALAVVVAYLFLQREAATAQCAPHGNDSDPTPPSHPRQQADQGCR